MQDPAKFSEKLSEIYLGNDDPACESFYTGDFNPFGKKENGIVDKYRQLMDVKTINDLAGFDGLEREMNQAIQAVTPLRNMCRYGWESLDENAYKTFLTFMANDVTKNVDKIWKAIDAERARSEAQESSQESSQQIIPHLESFEEVADLIYFDECGQDPREIPKTKNTFRCRNANKEFDPSLPNALKGISNYWFKVGRLHRVEKGEKGKGWKMSCGTEQHPETKQEASFPSPLGAWKRGCTGALAPRGAYNCAMNVLSNSPEQIEENYFCDNEEICPHSDQGGVKLTNRCMRACGTFFETKNKYGPEPEYWHCLQATSDGADESDSESDNTLPDESDDILPDEPEEGDKECDEGQNFERCKCGTAAAPCRSPLDLDEQEIPGPGLFCDKEQSRCFHPQAEAESEVEEQASLGNLIKCINKIPELKSDVGMTDVLEFLGSKNEGVDADKYEYTASQIKDGIMMLKGVPLNELPDLSGLEGVINDAKSMDRMTAEEKRNRGVASDSPEAKQFEETKKSFERFYAAQEKEQREKYLKTRAGKNELKAQAKEAKEEAKGKFKAAQAELKKSPPDGCAYTESKVRTSCDCEKYKKHSTTLLVKKQGVQILTKPICDKTDLDENKQICLDENYPYKHKFADWEVKLNIPKSKKGKLIPGSCTWVFKGVKDEKIDQSLIKLKWQDFRTVA
jgi:hypothetical protein